jgi:hypothetical protein
MTYDPNTRVYGRQELQYRADFNDLENANYGKRGGLAPCAWRPSIYMPRRASRITLEITEVRVQRVQAITREDARAEGISEYLHEFIGVPSTEADADVWRNHTTVENFAALWDSLNAKHGFGWDANPWVWVIEFKRLEK